MAQDDRPGRFALPQGVEAALKATARPQDMADLVLLAGLLIESAGAEAVAGVDPETLAAFVREAFEFIADKPASGTGVRVRAAEMPAGAKTRRLATIQTLNDDMPFLVDSVMGEVQAKGLSALMVVHPIYKAERDGAGRLLRILGPGDRNWSDGRQESYIAVILDPIEEVVARSLETSLPEVLAEVRAAVADWRAMLARLEAAIGELERTVAGQAEALTFCRWLLAGQFTFLGARRCEAAAPGGTAAPVAGSGLGVLRGREHEAVVGPEAVATGAPVVFAKTSILARVHRRVAMDYVAISLAAGAGTVREEFVGLLTSSAYTQSPRDIPFLRRKVEAVVARSGHPPQSHAGKALINVLETFPRDELFLMEEAELAGWANAVLDLDLRPRVRLLARKEAAGAGISAIVYVPRDRFSTAVRERIGALLCEAWGGRITSVTPFFAEGPLVRVHFRLAADPTGDLGIAALEAGIAQAVRTWEDRLAEAIAAEGDAAPALHARYRAAFPPGYRSDKTPARAVEDIRRLERLSAERSVVVDFYQQGEADGGRLRAAVFRVGPPIPLSERVPMLENFGFTVIDERTYEIGPFGNGAPVVALHDMQLETSDMAPVALKSVDARLETAILKVLAGEADNDAFNRLVLVAGLDWREAAMLRAYAAYARQMRVPFGPRYIADTLARHAGMARDLVALFRARFDPDTAVPASEREGATREILARLESALAGVASLDEDRILRLLMQLIGASVRTNFFQQAEDGSPPGTISFKLASRQLDQLPAPRPFREIWVYAPRVEGVHLRFAPIARGGIRWSDRAQDFRTEVLGLAKAQQVKNAVIVPQGAKGGFLPKRLPRSGSREEVAREGLAAYRVFIGALLDITDNLKDGAIVPPPRVVRHDGDDPYLVVAADKGTATFSDTANEIAQARGFWLGDAFASGGSAGYDHKGMGITARGAFECIRRHFREMDRDIDAEPFTAVGVGDMSGDVFGNGMLLSQQTRLIAAFDHRDIFVDPDPDPAVSFAERQRLFKLSRSSWQDYDKALISPGGGVFPRSAKSIAVTPQMQAALGITDAALTPFDLIRAVLRAAVDLLWLGGIGTYVKAGDETDEAVGDRANDAVRVTGAEVRAKVVGEGANLGVTQRGRIEIARAGGRIDTDFIDNSAGVNTSDQEVNIKIALAPATLAGRIAPDARKALLRTMTDDVAAGSLRNNYQQSLALSLAEARGAGDLGYLQRLMQVLEGNGMLDRRLEALPSNAEIAQRQAAGRGLTRPELCVLLSFAKIALTEALLATDVPDRPAAQALLADYFPAVLRERYADDIARHRLRREIITTLLTNGTINRGGPAFVVRMADETGRTAADIAAAFLAARHALGLPGLWRQIDGLDGKVKGTLQLDLYRRAQDVLITATRWFARHADSWPVAETEVKEVVDLMRAGQLMGVMLEAQRRACLAEGERLVAAGVPQELADLIASLPVVAEAPAIAALMRDTKSAFVRAAPALFAAQDALRLTALETRAREIAVRDHYDRLAIDGALTAIRATGERTARRFLERGEAAPAPGGSQAGIAMAQSSIDDALANGALTASRLTVVAQRVRDLAG